MKTTVNQFETTTKEETPCIYAILNNNNFMVYVGESKNPMKRLEQHISMLKKGIHTNKKMQKDFNKGDRFTFIKLKDYGEDETESMRYYELLYMDKCRNMGIELYNSESPDRVKKLLSCNSKECEIRSIMMRKRDEYYKKYFGCTYWQFIIYDKMSKAKGQDKYFSEKIQQFYKKRRAEIRKEERERKSKYKKISIFIKKDVYKKIESTAVNPEHYIENLLEKSIERGA